MADVRVTRGLRPRTVGAPVGIQVSTFGLDSLRLITGADLLPILEGALEPAETQVREEWPVDTGASRDTLRIEADEVGAHTARVSLRIGGEPLIADARNVKHIDYAPFIEFNGSPGGSPPGILLYAMTSNARRIRDTVHEGVAKLMQERLQRG